MPPTEAELNKVTMATVQASFLGRGSRITRVTQRFMCCAFQLMDNLNIPVRPSKMPSDSRKCILCHGVGDDVTNGPGRSVRDVETCSHMGTFQRP